MKKISELIKNISPNLIIGDADKQIDMLSQDTRDNFTANTLYFAVPGTQVDGHAFIEQAIGQGAVAVVCENIPAPKSQHANVTYIQVASIVSVLGVIASTFYDNPSHRLSVLATTGTNGKTTVATLLHQSLLGLGKQSALFSTAGDYINQDEVQLDRKAPSSMETIEFHKNLKRAYDAGCTYVCIEATSHALDQQRLNGTQIRAGIFTNLTQDHLDYHKTMDHYASSKKKLFDMLTQDSIAITNIDDSYGAYMVQDSKASIVSYGNKKYENPITRDVMFDINGLGVQGTKLSIGGESMHVNLVGVFNMYNITAVYSALGQLDFDSKSIKNVFSQLQGVPGRMEIITGRKHGVVGIVDYAHSPDALQKVLETLTEMPHNRIITIIGVGGDRDRSKRPQMAQITQKHSDYVFYTSDNPRTEDLDQIFSDLLSGCDTEKNNYTEIRDREQAIKSAVEFAETGDIILIAGKGHEDYQIIGTEKIHFSDKEVLRKYL